MPSMAISNKNTRIHFYFRPIITPRALSLLQYITAKYQSHINYTVSSDTSCSNGSGKPRLQTASVEQKIILLPWGTFGALTLNHLRVARITSTNCVC